MGVQLSPTVAIIGAGWAGLTAAVRLADAGLRVTVFESAHQAGGRARSVDWNGSTVDNGQHLLVGAYSATLAVMRQVGVDPDRALRRIPLTVEVPGQLSLRLPRWPAPLHLAAGLLAARGAPLAEKIAAARFMQRLKAARYRLAEDLPVATWLDANQQQGVLRTQLWDALCLAALNTRPEAASAQIFANVLRDTLGGPRHATDMLLPATDLGRLFPEAALQHLRRAGAICRLRTRVAAIHRDPETGAWWLTSDEQASQFDHVVLAAAPQHTGALLPPAPELAPLRTAIERLEWEPIATVYLQYGPEVRLPQPLLALNHGPAQWLADRGQLGGPAGLLAHVLSGSGDWQGLANHDLAASLHSATNAVFARRGALPPLPSPRSQLVIRERRATFRCSPGLVRPAGQTPLPGLWLAGDYVASDYPATIEAAVRSGDAAAAGIVQAATLTAALRVPASGPRA